MRRFLALLCAMLLTTLSVFAQNKVVTGQITDEKGEPIGFASVKIKDSKQGVSADANGNFRIEAPVGSVLVISAIGANQKEITVTGSQSAYSVALTKGSTELSTVVVSALGIKRSVKSTPYAVQQISAERLTQTRETDLTSALSGKISGLQVLGQSGAKLGSVGATRLRGVAGFRDNGAIYVVDGTIVTNVTDINMDDVASVSVLKGPNATALYGQRAEGGVIMITTRKAGKNKPLTVEFNSTTTLEKVNLLPQYQNLYGGGNNSNPNNAWAENPYTWKAGDPIEWKALNGYRRQQYYDDASWGPRLDGGDYIPWYAWYGGHSRSYKPAKFEAQPDNVRDFFQTGLTANNNVSVAKGGSWWNGRLSYTNLYKKGIIPYSSQTKNFISTQASVDPIKNLTISTNIGVTFEKFKGDFYDAYSNNTIGSFSQWFHRNIDMKILKELRGLKTPGGNFASWNIDDAAGISPAAIEQPTFWYNPYTWLENLDNKTDRFRILGDVSVSYKVTNDIKVTGTYRLNYRTTNTEVKIPQILENSAGSAGYTSDEQGNIIYSKYRKDETKYRENNFELIAQYNKRLGNVNIDFVGGGNLLDIKRDDSSRQTSGGLVKPDVFELSNSVGKPVRGGLLSYRQVRSLFFRGTLGYKDFIYLDFSGRNDWSSTLPKNKNSYFYPSIGTSFIFSEFLKGSVLSYGKIRASAAQIGSDPLAPYALQLRYTTGLIPFGNDSLTTVPNNFIDPNLKSPINTSYEVGFDVKFFRDRLGLSVTGYKETRENEIVATSVSTASGFNSGTINAGIVKRKGVEVEITAKPIASKNFNWDVSFNWAMNRSRVEKVSDATDLFTIYANYVGQPLIVGVAGKEWGQMRATGIKRINGLPVIDPNGFYVPEDDVDFGTVLPNYTGGIFNSFSYKGFTLSASIDFQQGGKYFSFSDFNGKYSGLNKETADINDRGVNVREPLSAGGGVHVYGVLEDGHPYDTYVNGYDYFRQFSSTNIWNYSIFDASYMKLREVSLGYDIPVQRIGNLSKTIKRAYVSVVGRNLWLIYTSNKNIDPTEIAETYAENGQLPGTKSYGLNLKINF